MQKIGKLNNKQKITVILIITVFVVSLFLSIKNSFQINKVQADITSLNMKNNIVILNVNSTKQKLINKIGNNISVKSNNIEISNSTKIKTGDMLQYNNINYPIAILGDVNNDGIVSGSDISQIYSKYKNKISFDEVQALAADVNGDGSITGSDVSGSYSIYKNPPIDTEDDTFTITFDSNGGTNVETITRYSNDLIGTLPIPTKSGCKFDGWYTLKTDGIKITENTIVTDNVTYYAHWSYIDAIHFLNVGSSDSILIQTQGKYGLVDVSNPSNGSLGYNDSINNGTKVLNYLNELGVTHLDFIIASHNHSDHIGGIPELVNNSSLVNSNTVYIYKNVFVDEFGGEVTEGVRAQWNNNLFANAALTAMQNKNAKLLETNNHSLDSLNNINATFFDNIDKNKQYISFDLGNYNIKIYNLYTFNFISSAGKGYDYTTTDENTNSLVTLITTNNNQKVLLMGDMNVENSLEQFYGELIGKVDVIKASHHGYHYSNSKKLFEATMPSLVFIPNNLELLLERPGTISSTIQYLTSSVSEFGAARLYLKQNGTRVYETGNSNDAYVVLFDASNITVKNLEGNSFSDNVNEISQNVKNGWHIWFDDNSNEKWYYVKDNSFVTGWQNINGERYYFYNGEYGEKSKGQMAHNEFIDGYWLEKNGACITGQKFQWYEDSYGKTYGYKNSNSEYYLANDSYYIDGKKYYFEIDGYCINP